MRKITTAITAAALAFSMLAAAVPAAAVTGYDSAYAGESAFVNISPGQTQNFQVFFANTGTTSWQRGTGTQVDLAACLEDKVTCNAQDASEATWNNGWLSAVRYATTTQTITPPGSLGTFSYNITAPAGVAVGIYRFNGDLVLASTGEKIHPEGYYQEANNGTTAGAATLTSIAPALGSTAGGTPVTLKGSGFVCTPAFPTVSFGGTNAVVTSCGASQLTVSSPAHAAGSVGVTVTNSGGTASNSLNFLYQDQDDPLFTSMSVSGNVITVVFNEPVCHPFGSVYNDADWSANNVSAGTTPLDITGDTIPICTSATDRSNATTTGALIVNTTTPIPQGAFVEATLNESSVGAGENIRLVDVANNPATAPVSRQATATAAETTPPTIASASGAVGTQTIKVTFSEPVYCTGTQPPAASWSLNDFNTTNDPDPTITAVSGCGIGQAAADNSINLTTSAPLPADVTYTLTYDGTTNEIQDLAQNDLADQAVAFTTGAGDFSPPTMVDARMVNNAGPSTNFTETSDSFSLTFSEKMNGATNGTISIQDQDGTTATIGCAGNTFGFAVTATCTWNPAVTTMTVTLTAALPPDNNGATPPVSTGTTPNMQIPFNVTALQGITDAASPGNPPNVLGSADRLVDYE